MSVGNPAAKRQLPFGSKIFVVGFSKMCPVHLLEDDVGLPRSIKRGQFGVNDDEQTIVGQ